MNTAPTVEHLVPARGEPYKALSHIFSSICGDGPTGKGPFYCTVPKVGAHYPFKRVM
jgi:hypothetical protein